MIPEITDDSREFVPPQSMTTRELGDELARLVWESFTDFLTEEAEALQKDLGLSGSDEGLDQRIVQEMLIFLMWSHTRAVQLAFIGRSSEDLIRSTLDSLHHAVFDDLVANGTPRSQLPFFEQRVGARYAEYYAAAETSDGEVGMAALRHLGIKDNPSMTHAWSFAERAIETAYPLRDFLEDVSLVD